MGELGSFLSYGSGLIIGGIVIGLASNSIPTTSKVSEGFIAPSKLEIKVENIDGIGSPETIMEIDKRPYLLKYDTNGNPVLQDFIVKSKEIIVLTNTNQSATNNTNYHGSVEKQ